MDRGAWWATVHGDTTEQLTLSLQPSATHRPGQLDKRRLSVNKSALLINFLLINMWHCKHFSSSREVLFSFLGQGFLNL